MARIFVNGCGRIGRRLISLLSKQSDHQLVGVNDLAVLDTIIHLLKYDSVHGRNLIFKKVNEQCFEANAQKVAFFSERNPENLPLKELNVDVVVESTGFFRTKELASKHLIAGAKKVIISAPPEGDDYVKTVVLGINGDSINSNDIIISNASCTTNCAAPMVQVINDLCGIESAYITTVHSYTTDQKLHDAPHKDLRRARAAAENIVPTTTGAAKALTKIFPELEDKLGGCGIRVPVPNGSLTDITFLVKKEVSFDQVNKAFYRASKGYLNGILEYTEEPIVSKDIIGNPHSVIFDGPLTSVIGKMVKVVGWYDNEAGYSNRIIDLIDQIN